MTTSPSTQPPIASREVAAALAQLAHYRAAKAVTDSRISEEAAWWAARHAGGQSGSARADDRRGTRPTSAWLFSSISNKHADLCDARPTCVALPRDPADEAEAARLSDILPAIAARVGFAETYSENTWSKLKHGIAAYGVFWNPALAAGIGDIDIRRLDVRNIFWDPGVRDIQESPALFVVGLESSEALALRYPQFAAARAARRTDPDALTPELGGHYLDRPTAAEGGLDTGAVALGGGIAGALGGAFAAGLSGGSASPMGDRTAVVDWYYKRPGPDGVTRLHFCKLAGDTLLYASENDPAYAERGWYDHGLYPIVLDVLYPEEGTPGGYGLIAVGRNPQGYIDELDGHILSYANHASRVRYWAKRSLGVSEREFLDPDRSIIEVEGDLDEEKLRQITLSPMDGLLTEIRRMKIDELKETTGNRDVSQGSTSGGVTAASAITALQEAGNKGSRDMIMGTYRAYTRIMEQVVELIRQFYDGVRCFRIPAAGGGYTYLHYANTALLEHPVAAGAGGEPRYRRPLFDMEVRAEREAPLDRAGRNQLMLELFRAGMLDPEHEVAARRALAGMDFEGIDRLRLSLSGADVRGGSARVDTTPNGAAREREVGA